MIQRFAVYAVYVRLYLPQEPVLFDATMQQLPAGRPTNHDCVTHPVVMQPSCILL